MGIGTDSAGSGSYFAGDQVMRVGALSGECCCYLLVVILG